VKLSRLLLLLPGLLCGLACADVTNELRVTEQRQAWTNDANKAAWFGDFEALEREFARKPEDAKDPFQRADRVNSLFTGLYNTFNMKASDAYYEQLEALTLANAQAHPQSPLAHLLYLEAMTSHGWAIRGSSFAREVPQAAWDGMTRQFKAAYQYLQMHKDVVLREPRGYIIWMYMGRAALQMDVDQTWQLAQAAIKLDPYDDAIYEEMLTALLPRWGGGSPEQIEAFVREASKLASPQWGHGMYARLYTIAFAVEYKHGLFEKTRANWAELKLGFEDLAVRVPSIRNRLRYAYFACMAKDRETFQTQTGLISGMDLKSHIQDIIGANADRIWEDCKRWGAGL
jgi:hypothetical protein